VLKRTTTFIIQKVDRLYKKVYSYITSLVVNLTLKRFTLGYEPLIGIK